MNTFGEPHKWIPLVPLSADTGSVSNIAGFVQVCRFSAFLQVAGKSSQNGKMFENGNIFTKRGKYSPLGKCSPKRESFHVQRNFPSYFENRENLPLQTFRGKYFPSKLSRRIFSLKNFGGNIFPKFPGEYFGGTS